MSPINLLWISEAVYYNKETTMKKTKKGKNKETERRITMQFEMIARQFRMTINKGEKFIYECEKCIYSLMSFIVKLTSLFVLLALLVALMHEVWQGVGQLDYAQYKPLSESRIIKW